MAEEVAVEGGRVGVGLASGGYVGDDREAVSPGFADSREVAGGVLGLALAIWWSDLLIALGKQDIPRAIQVGLDWRVLGFTPQFDFARGMDLTAVWAEWANLL